MFTRQWALRILLICIVTVFVIGLIVYSVDREGDKIKVPFSNRDFNGKSFQDAQAILMDAGFSNIEAIAQKDLWDGFLHNDQGNVGKVALITINGDERFRENDLPLPNKIQFRSLNR